MRQMPPDTVSGGVVFQVDIVHHGDDLALGIMPACRTDVMGALQLAAIGAFGAMARGECIMRAALVAARFRDLVLLDGHVTTSRPAGGVGPRFTGVRGS